MKSLISTQSTGSALALVLGGLATPVLALDAGSPLQLNTYNGWLGFEVASVGENVPGDGYDYSLPGTFDGLGASLVGDDTFRIWMNHETSQATISQIDLSLPNFQTAITNVMANNANNATGGISFVTSAKQAYGRISYDGGLSFVDGAAVAPDVTSFSRFCSSQYFQANTYGAGRGFVDGIYLTGEEGGAGRLMALDTNMGDLYQLSGNVGAASGGIPGMPFDPWENAALLDTGETDHVAMILSPDGGSRTLYLYVGEKGKDANGAASVDFLARNGLAYGSYYVLNAPMPGTVGETVNDGFFDTDLADGFTSSKLEDVDTSPSSPDKFVLADQNSGAFVFDTYLEFVNGEFDPANSGFSVTMVGDQGPNILGTFNNPDNTDWTDATVLDGEEFADGLLFFNEDDGDGEVWFMLPDGSGVTQVASTIPNTESSGILDVSEMLGYNPGSILLTDNQGSLSSLSVLINPRATAHAVPEPASAGLAAVLGAMLLGLARHRRRRA